MRGRTRLALLLSLAVATLALAQLKESVTVAVIEVPVTVVGRDGNPVRGLTAANFEIFDDGKKRMVTGFEAIDFMSPQMTATAAMGQSATAPMNPAARRNFLLLFDLSFSKPASMSRAQAAAREFVTKSMNRRDRIAVATFDVGRGFNLVTAFTTDRIVVQQAISSPSGFHNTDPLQVGSIGVDWMPEPVVLNDAGDGEIAQRQAEAMGRAAQTQREWVRRSGEFDDQHQRQQVDRELEILAAISRTMHTVMGRKEIILLSEGFDSRFIQGWKPNSREAQEDQVAIEKGEIWRVSSEQRFGSATSASLLLRFAEVCRRSDVVLHALDIKGLRVDSDVRAGTGANSPRSAGSDSNEGLHLLANAGGGTVFKNTNDFSKSFDRLMRQQEVIYILAFKPATNNPGAFHNLKVKVVDTPPGSRVSHRTGYYEGGSASEAERTLATAEIMVNDIPQSDIAVETLPSVFGRSGERAAVPVIVDINGADLMRLKDDIILVAEVFVYAFDTNGSVRDSLFQRLTLDTEKLSEKLRDGGVKYLGTLSLPPGQYAIKTLVRLPELGHNGFVRKDIVVPERTVMAMSPPLFFDDGSRWVLVKGASHDPSGAYPFVVNEAAFVPSAVVRVATGERRRFAVFVDNAAQDAALDVSPDATFVGRSGDAFVYEISGDPKAASVEVGLRGTAVKTSMPLRMP